MKKITQTSILCLLMLFLMPLAQAQELEKNFDEAYDVNADVEVVLSNTFGPVNVQTWAEKRVVIDIKVSVDSKSKEKSQEIIDNIDVEISGSATKVQAIAKVDKIKCDHCEFEIEMEVKIPTSASLDLTSSFGSAFVDDIEGNVKANVSYGNLEMGKLMSKENYLKLSFGSFELDEVKAAEINVEYGSLELGKAGFLDLYSRFNGIEIGEVSELIMDTEYDGFEIGSVDNLRAKAAFTAIEIGEVFDKLDLTSSYGGIEVNRIAKGFSSIDITSEFGAVELDVSSTASYSLHAETSFGDIEFPKSNAKIIRQIDDTFSKEVEAFVGDDASSGSKVYVKASNCDVLIK